MPRYSTGYYFSEPAKPTVSEERVFASYREHFNYPRTVREMIQRIQQSNEVPVGEETFHLHHRKKYFFSCTGVVNSIFKHAHIQFCYMIDMHVCFSLWLKMVLVLHIEDILIITAF